MIDIEQFIKNELKNLKRKMDETDWPSDVIDVYFHPARCYPVTSTPKPSRKLILLRDKLLLF